MTHRHPGHVEPKTWATARPVSAPPAAPPRQIPPDLEAPSIVTFGDQARLTVGDRWHWQMDTRQLNISRWCPGAPCSSFPAQRPAGRHWLRVRFWRRSWTARYREPRQSWSPPD